MHTGRALHRYLNLTRTWVVGQAAISARRAARIRSPPRDARCCWVVTWVRVGFSRPTRFPISALTAMVN